MLTSNNYSILFSYQINLLCTIMLVVSIVMILLAVYGYWAAYSINITHLSMFWGILIACALFLMVVGVLGITLPRRIRKAGCGSTYYPSMSAINYTASKAKRTICQNCTCYYNVTNSSANISTYNTNSTDISLPVRAQNCTNWEVTAYDDTLASLERDFSCAAWCPGTVGAIYLMTNVNNGVPSRSCFNAVMEWFELFCRRISIPAFIFAGAIVVIEAMVWWNLCEIVDMRTEYVLATTGKSAPIINNTTYEMTVLPQPVVQVPYQPPPPPMPVYNQYPYQPSGNISSLAEINPYYPQQQQYR